MKRAKEGDHDKALEAVGRLAPRKPV